jgi:hypothetical protein
LPWYIPDPERLGIYVLFSCVAFPVGHLLVRGMKGKRVTRGQFVDKIVLGASAPTFAFLAMSPLDPALLAKISDQQYILCMTGVIGLALCFFSLFDSDS